MTYQKIFEESLADPVGFWKTQARQIKWSKTPEQILRIDNSGYGHWYEDGKLNMCRLCVDDHVSNGFGDQTAIIYDSPVTGRRGHISFHELQREVSRLAGGLEKLGLKKGDTAIIYMPMIPQATYAMLACARIGVIHSVVFGGFAPHELAIRIDDCQPKVIITASNGIEVNKVIEYKPIVDAAINEAEHKPSSVILYDRQQGVDYVMKAGDYDYSQLVESSVPAEVVEVESSHPLYILYTSGTTGTPKGVLRDTGGYAVALKFSMKSLYGAQPGDVFWAASDLGWVVGHSYILYGPLLNRNSTVLYEGKPVRTPDASSFWRILDEHAVNVMFTAPTALRAIKREDPQGKLISQFNLSQFKCLFLAGERCDAATLHWAEDALGVPVIDHWWQTESGWPMLANLAGIELMPVKAGSAGVQVPGYDIRVLRADGTQANPNESGIVAVKLPLPPGNLLTLWNNPKRFHEAYFATFDGFYNSGDAGYIDEDGYVFITGRIDDIINVAGHRLSTGEMEEVVASHRSVAECAVFGVADELKGEIPLCLVVLKSDALIAEEVLQQEIIQSVRNTIGPVASLKKVLIVKRLPKTRSGKILRKTMRKIADGKPYRIPSTIDDPAVLDEIKEVLLVTETV